MGLIRDALGDTIGQSSGCAILLVCLLPFACVKMAIDSRHEKQQKIETDREETARYCRAKRSMSDDEAFSECRNAAAAFGQGDDPSRLSSCVESRQNDIAMCSAKGL